MKKEKCLRCGHEWLSRTEKPLQCPRCKRYDWNKKVKIKLRGKKK